jgi:inner membrane protein
VLAARVLTPVAPQRGLDTVARPGLAACLLVGLLAGAFPDIDSLLGLLSPIAYLVGHRGVTHSLVLLPLWAALLAWVFSGFGRRRDCIRPFFIISAAALAVHVLGDLITAFGTMLFEPISDRRFALSATFIIDLWFSGIALAGVLATVLLPRWPDADRRTRLVFITRDLDESYVRRLWDAFAGMPAPDTPDRAALTDNPLSLRPGNA